MSDAKDFKFTIPMELVKGENEAADSWRVRGIASTGDKDLQGETVAQQGLDISSLKAGRGLFNFDHQKGPENVLGQIEDAEFVKYNGDKALQVDGYLFKHSERGKAMYNIMRSVKKGNSSRVHMSIEGKIMERNIHNPADIKRARIDKVALTLDPVNPYTYADLCKSLNTDAGPSPEVVEASPETIEITDEITISKSELESMIVDAVGKALSAGAGYGKAPQARSGGEAMSTESMENELSNVTYDKKKRKSEKEMVKSIIDGLQKVHPNHDPIELAHLVVESFITKLKGESRD